MNRDKALAFIRDLRETAAESSAERVGRFGAYVVRSCPHPDCGQQITRKAGVCAHCRRPVPAAAGAPPRGRPCPNCGRRITRKECTCRHCGMPVRATAEVGGGPQG